MSSPLSSDKDRDVTTPPAATPGPEQVRRADILEELQKALDAARVAGASHQAPPLQPRADEGAPLKRESPPPPPRSRYAPPAARRVETAAAELTAALRSKPSVTATPDLVSPMPRAPEKLGSVSARASAERSREQRRIEERPAPEFMRIARPRLDQAHSPNALAASRPVQDGRGGLRTANIEQEDDELLRRILQRQQPPPWEELEGVKPAQRRWTARVGYTTLIGLIVGSLGFLVYQFFGARAPNEHAATNQPTTSSLSSTFSKANRDRVAEKNAPKLVLSAVSGSPNRPVALGVNIDAAPSDSFILIRGLQPGSRVTAGVAAGDGVWRVPMRELPHAAVMPPQDFVGTMELAVDLRRGDDSVADSNVQRINWTAIGPSPAAAKPVKTTMISASQDVFPAPPSPRSPAGAPQTNGSTASSFDEPQRGAASRRLDPEEVHNLIQRGDAALQSGDIAAARLLLRRAAEAGDMTAAMALAATYDPGVLAQLGARGAKADVGAARDWYQKAAAWGSPDAKRRLQELAQQ